MDVNKSSVVGLGRESGVELLRIIAASMVIWLHMNIPWAMSIVPEGINGLFLHIIEVIAVPAVDIFILISGYFMINKKSVSFGKPISLLLQLLLINLCFFLPSYFFRYPQIPFNCGLFLPNNYFITLYICMYFLSPYINKILHGLNTKQCKTLLIISCVFLSLYPIIWDYIHLYTTIDIAGLSTVSRWHNDMGNNITTFLFVYIVGALINKTKIEEKLQKRTLLAIWLMTTMIMLGLYYIDERFIIDDYGYVTLYYHNPLVILQAAALFLIFKKIKIQSKYINKMAAAAFTCFLMQGNLLRFFRKDSLLSGNPIIMVIYYVLVAVAIYLISYIVFVLYNMCTKWLIDKLDKNKIVYYE